MFSSKLHFWIGTFTFILAVHLTALSTEGQDSRPVIRISIPGLGSTYTMPFQIAQEQGFYLEEGVDVRILGGVRTAPSIQMLVPIGISIPGLGSTYTMPFQIAQEQGFYLEEGVDVRILGGVRTAPSIQMLV